MKILITTTGSSGDINPFIAIGRELNQRGHDVLIVANPHARPNVEAAGLMFQPFGCKTDLRELVTLPNFMHARRGPQAVWDELVAREIPSMIEAVHVALDEFRPDVGLSHTLFIGTQWLCRQRGIPTAQAMISPRIWLSSHDASVFHPWEPRNPPRVYTRFQRMCTRAVVRRCVDPDVNRARRLCGLPERRNAFLEVIRDTDLALGLWSRYYRRPMKDDPGNGRICGFCWFDGHHKKESDDVDVRRFLEAGEPPIIFCLGSTAAHVAVDFYRYAAEACERLARRGLLLTGRGNNHEHDCLDGICAVRYAPLSKVAAAGCATVHHGGMGTTAQAMRAGKPTIIIPFAHDQFDNAARTRRLGVSETLSRRKLSSSSLSRALHKILENSSYTAHAQALGRQLAGENGAIQVADHLESLGTHRGRMTSFRPLEEALV